MFRRITTPESAPTPAPVYDFLNTNNDYDNPALIQDLRNAYQSTYESHYNHYWNDPAIAHEPVRTRRLLAAEAAATQARNDTQTEVLAHVTATASSELAAVTGPDRDDLLGRYNAQIWGWLDTPEVDWSGDKTSAGLPIGNGVYDRLARSIATREGVVVTAENTILAGKEAQMYSARIEVEQARSNYATMLSGKKTSALRKAYTERYGRRISKAEAREIASEEWRDQKLNFYDTIRQIRDTELTGTPEEKQLAINTELIQEDIREFHNLEVEKLNQMTDPKMGWLVQRLNRGNFVWRGAKNAGLGTVLFHIGATLTGATGGILAPAVGAALIGWRFYSRYATWAMRKENVVEASNADTQYYEAAMAQFTDAHKRTMTSQDIFSRADNLAATLEEERKTKEQRSRMWHTGAVIGTILLPRVALEVPGVRQAIDRVGDGVSSSWDWLRDRSPWAVDEELPHSPTVVDTTPDTDTPFTPEDSEAPIDSANTTAVVPDLTPEQWQGLTTMEMRTATGEYPWDRAVDYFNGDETRAANWLQEATQKAGGNWHNLGDGVATNDWISINGTSDTNAVWEALTAAHPVGR